jgi:hypothetical protein
VEREKTLEKPSLRLPVGKGKSGSGEGISLKPVRNYLLYESNTYALVHLASKAWLYAFIHLAITHFFIFC